MKKNGVFLFGISFFVLEIEYLMFLYYTKNEESDEIIGGSTKPAQHLVKNISRNIRAGNRNVHHKRNKMTNSVFLPGQHFLLQSISVNNQICPFAIL